MTEPRMPGEPLWSRLVNPTRAELERVQDRFGLHPLIVGDLLGDKQHPKFERFGEHRCLTIWDVRSDLDPSAGQAEIVLIFDDDELLIIQHGPGPALRDLDELLRRPGTIAVTSPIAAVYRILAAVVIDFEEVGAEVERELDEVEAEVFDSRVHEDYRRIYKLRQRIGHIDRAVSGLAEALSDARPAIEAATDAEPALRPYFRHLVHDANGVARLAAAEHAALDAVVSSHQSNVSTRQNQDMRTISAFAAMLAIPTLIAGVYGMNFKHLPPFSWDLGWIIVIAAMVVLDVLAYIAFRRRGWLGKHGGTSRKRDDG